MNTKLALHIDHMNVFYGNNVILNNISLCIPYGKIVAILGPNGSGKSSLIKGILELTEHTVRHKEICGIVGGANNWHSKVAYIPQKNSIFWNFPIDVFGFVSMALYKNKFFYSRLLKEEEDLIMQYLTLLDISHLASVSIKELSGGEQQRMFFARALLLFPDIYILDEPFIGIDQMTEQKIEQLLLQEQQKGKTIIIVHHNLYHLNIFDWVCLINKEVIDCGEISQVLTEQNLQKTYQSDSPHIFKLVVEKAIRRP